MNLDPAQPGARIYAFDGFRVDPVKRLIYADGEPLPLKAKAFETLLYLIRNAGKVVERDELLGALWPDTVVEENNLTQHISALRRALGEKPDQHRYIATIPGRGYKFVAEVSVQDIETDAPEPVRESAGEPNDLTWPGRRLLWLAACLVLTAFGGYYLYFTRAGTGEVPRSIAVLPFKPLVPGRGDESLEMGMADTLISKLGKVETIVVRPLTAVRRFNSVDQDAIEAGKALGVEAVLEGSIQLDNDSVRISAKLLRIADSRQLWSGHFDERLTDIFAVQDSISERVANALEARLAQGSKRHNTDNAEAYQLYVRGRYHSFKLTPEETMKGLQYFERAIAIDPNYALAYAGVSDAYRTLALSSEYPPKETFEKSIAAGQKALELDDKLPEGHITLANSAFWYGRDWPAAEAELRKGLELDPNSAVGHIFYAHLLSNTGRHAEAIAEAGKARAIDPVSPFVSSLEGQFLLQAGKPADALVQLTKASEIDPTFWMPHMYASRVYIETGKFEEAETSAHRASQLSPAQSISIGYESYAAARLGKRDKAQALLGELLQRSAQRYVPPYHLAIAYMGLGDRENTLLWLERSVAEHDPKAAFLKVEGIWDEIRAEPRFVALMERMDLQ